MPQFTKTQDVADLTAMETKLAACVSAKGTRNEPRALVEWEGEKTTVKSRSALNQVRLSLDSVDLLVASGHYQEAKNIVTNILAIINSVP